MGLMYNHEQLLAAIAIAQKFNFEGAGPVYALLSMVKADPNIDLEFAAELIIASHRHTPYH